MDSAVSLNGMARGYRHGESRGRIRELNMRFDCEGDRPGLVKRSQTFWWAVMCESCDGTPWLKMGLGGGGVVVVTPPSQVEADLSAFVSTSVTPGPSAGQPAHGGHR